MDFMVDGLNSTRQAERIQFCLAENMCRQYRTGVKKCYS